MLKQLTEQEFERRATKANRVAVFKEFLADRETPVAALSRLSEDEECFLLESVAGGETRGRFSYFGIEPCAKVEGADAINELRHRFAECRYEPAPELPTLQGGAIGYIAYDAVGIFEPHVGLTSESGTPPMSLRHSADIRQCARNSDDSGCGRCDESRSLCERDETH